MRLAIKFYRVFACICFYDYVRGDNSQRAIWTQFKRKMELFYMLKTRCLYFKAKKMLLINLPVDVALPSVDIVPQGARVRRVFIAEMNFASLPRPKAPLPLPTPTILFQQRINIYLYLFGYK